MGDVFSQNTRITVWGKTMSYNLPIDNLFDKTVKKISVWNFKNSCGILSDDPFSS